MKEEKLVQVNCPKIFGTTLILKLHGFFLLVYDNFWQIFLIKFICPKLFGTILSYHIWTVNSFKLFEMSLKAILYRFEWSRYDPKVFGTIFY